jgi:hypothetical protein
MTLKCSHITCYDNAKWIRVIGENIRGEKYLTTTGTYFYCDKHKGVVAKATRAHFVPWNEG